MKLFQYCQLPCQQQQHLQLLLIGEVQGQSLSVILARPKKWSEKDHAEIKIRNKFNYKLQFYRQTTNWIVGGET